MCRYAYIIVYKLNQDEHWSLEGSTPHDLQASSDSDSVGHHCL